MKRFTFLLGFMVAATSPVPSRSSDTIPPEAQKLISRAVDDTTPHLVAAINLANRSSGDDKNFAALAKKLTGFGFGNPPVSPPWMRKQEEETKNLSEEDRKKESAERIKRLGQYDIDYLKAIDSNGDLKTDEQEIGNAIRQMLSAVLKDKLSVDGDGDRRLTIHEYALAVPAKGEKDEEGIDWHQRSHFEHDDQNDDGYLDMQEMMGHEARAIVGRALLVHLVFLLPEADADANGMLSEGEFSSLSETADGHWETASPNGEPIAIGNAYPSLYWLPNDTVLSLLSE